MSEEFNRTEKRILKAMFRLDRFANANEISKVADDLSWATTKKNLIKLHMKDKILDRKIIKGKKNYKIKEGIL